MNKKAFNKSRGVVAVILCGYILYYILVSRYSATLTASVGGTGFYYVPVSLVTMAKSPTLQAAHRICTVLFWPINYIDRHAWGGPCPGAPPMPGVAGKGEDPVSDTDSESSGDTRLIDK